MHVFLVMVFLPMAELPRFSSHRGQKRHLEPYMSILTHVHASYSYQIAVHNVMTHILRELCRDSNHQRPMDICVAGM